MSKKQKIIFSIIGFIFSLAALLLTIFLVPNQIPLMFDISEKISIKGSKYFLLLLIIMPMLFAFLSISLKSSSAKFIFKLLFIVSIYEIMITFIYLLTGKRFEVGQTPDIPLTCFIFIPLSLLIMAIGAKFKTTPYNSKLGMHFKFAKETDFIWKQTHFFASRVFLLAGLILLILSAIFSFFYLCFVVLIIFVITLAISLIIVYSYSYSIYKKYISMKEKHEQILSEKKNKI